MTFDKNKIITIGLCVSIGLNVIFGTFLLKEKISDTSNSATFRQENKQTQTSSAVLEVQPEPEIKIEKEYEVLIPELRENDPSNDGWMTKKWSGVYSNPGREFFTSNPSDPQMLDSEECPELNYDESNSYVVFENEELTMRLPFNEKWGGDFKLAPYIEHSKGLSWGNLSIIAEGWSGEGCPYLHRSPMSLVWEPKNELIDYLTELKNKYSDEQASGMFEYKLTRIPSNSNPDVEHTVIEFSVGGLGVNSYIVFFGNKNMYIFEDQSMSGFDALEDIVSTIELK